MSSDRTKESAKVERDNVSIVIFINRSRNCHMLVSGEARSAKAKLKLKEDFRFSLVLVYMYIYIYVCIITSFT